MSVLMSCVGVEVEVEVECGKGVNLEITVKSLFEMEDGGTGSLRGMSNIFMPDEELDDI